MDFTAFRVLCKPGIFGHPSLVGNWVSPVMGFQHQQTKGFVYWLSNVQTPGLLVSMFHPLFAHNRLAHYHLLKAKRTGETLCWDGTGKTLSQVQVLMVSVDLPC